MIYIATIKEGKVILANRKRFEADLATLKDGQYELIIRLKNRRSTPQNDYYWGVVIWEIRHRLEQLGNRFTPDQIHDLLKAKFLAIQVSNDQGELLEVPGSTSGLNKEEFSLYLDKVIQWASEFLGIEIPEPNTQLTVGF